MSIASKPLDQSASIHDGRVRATIKDVASASGLSPMTVWRAVNKPGGVPTATLARVETAITKTGYIPNLLAGGLRSSKSRLVVALMPIITKPAFHETLLSLASSLAAAGYQLIVSQIGDLERQDEYLERFIMGHQPQGVVLIGMNAPDKVRLRFNSWGTPLVETWGSTRTACDFVVGFSHTAVAERICLRFRSIGCRHLAIIISDDENLGLGSHEFLSAAQAFDFSSLKVLEVSSNDSLGQGRDGIRKLLKERPETDGVFCSSDLIALGVLQETHLMNIGVPKQLAIIGFGDCDFAEGLQPTLTSVRVKAGQIGNEAARCIIELAEGRSIQPNVIDVGFSLIERDSG